MNWTLLRNQLVNLPQHHERPQSAAMIDHALAQVQSGLEQLARLGHPFHLEIGIDASQGSWPRTVYHLQKAPRGFLCLCEQDLEDVLGGEAAGWFSTLEEAKHAGGMERQFTRGGVFPAAGLPAVQEEDLSPLDRERLAGRTAPDGTRY